MAKSARLVLEAQRAMANPSNRAQQESLAAAGKEVSRALGGTMSCLPGQAEVEQSIVQIDTLSKKIDMGDFSQSGRPYGELQSELSGAVDKLNQATDDVVQAAPQPERLAAKSRHFSQVLGQMMECSMDMAGQTRVEETRVEMVSTMKNVTMSSSTFLSSAKTVAVDPSAPQAKNNLANAAR